MWRFISKLAGKIKSAAKKAWNWLKGTAPAKFIARCYNRALDLTAVPMMKIFYGGRRRCDVFGSTPGQWVVRAIWMAVVAPLTVGIAAYEVLRPPVKLAVQGVLLVTGFAWAALTVVWTLEVGLYYWLLNTLTHGLVRSGQWLYHKIAGTPAMPRRVTRYLSVREALAQELALLSLLHPLVLRLSRRVIGDAPTHWLVLRITNTVARLHGPTYDWAFKYGLPYGTPEDGGETYALHIQDVPANWHLEPEVSEQEKSANWFISNGYVLIATDAPDKTDVEVFNEYMRTRWANLNAAEIATDEHGRTWVVPFRAEPLFKDVATTAPQARVFADQEMAWQEITDPVARSYSYGRHWAASLADQDPNFLEDSSHRVRERAYLHQQMKGRSDLHIEHLLRGFDDWVGEHRSVATV